MSGSTLQHTTRLNPRTLRDLLNENSTSCSSNGFKSFPRKPIPSTTMRTLIEMDLNSSSRNSNPRILNSLLNALIKRFSSFTAKPPSMLPRSLSRKLSKKSSSRNYRPSEEINVTVRIKDIVRWRSFQDLEEQPPPLDFSAASTSCSSSKGSSWSDSDFSSCDGNNFVDGESTGNDVGERKGFSPLVGKDSVYRATETSVGAKGGLTGEEEEQKSPVSVLQIGEDEFSPFDQSLLNIERLTSHTTLERCMSMEEYNDESEQERMEKMARKLLHYVEGSGSVQWSKGNNLNKVLLDFFKDEVKKRRNNDEDDECFEWEILRKVQEWMESSSGNDLENSDKDACMRDMDKSERWSKFEEEIQELAWQIETAILETLIVDIFNASSSY